MTMQRSLTDAIGWATAYGAVIVSASLAARYGVKVADSEIDAWLRGASLFFIAVVGCHGVSWGARIWLGGLRIAGSFIALGSLVCFAVTLAGGLGTVASGTDHSQSERSRSIDDRNQDVADRARFLADKGKLPAYTPTTKDGVDAANKVVQTATEAREKECGTERGGRGAECRKREDKEATAREAYTRAVADKAATDAAAEIDAKIADIDRRMKGAGAAARSADPQATFISRLASRIGLAMSDDEAAAWYAFGVSLAMELAAMIALVAATINASRHSASQAPVTAAAPAPAPTAAIPPPAAPLAAAEPVSAPVRAAQATEAPKRPAPKPAPAHRQAAVGDVEAYATRRLARSGESKAALREIYGDYRGWCLNSDMQPLPAQHFVEGFNVYCERARIKIKTIGDNTYCLGVRIGVDA